MQAVTNDEALACVAGSEDGNGTGDQVLHSGPIQKEQQVDTSRTEGEAYQFPCTREEVCLELTR